MFSLPKLALAAAFLIAAPAQAESWGAAKFAFGAMEDGSAQAPDPIGSYARGCVAGAVALPETGPTWQAMRLSRNRNWGHPDTIAFLQRLSRAAAEQPGWEGIYVGDISQPRGGPMLSGHASHQMGLDADIWMRRADRLNLTRQEREDISSISVRSADMRGLSEYWSQAHYEIMRAAAKDPAVARIFVTAPVKQYMCDAAGEDRDWLRKVRPWWGHHYHFHVRLHCPPGAAGCVDQAPPPAGDGCDATLAWWTSDEALVPAPTVPRPDNAPRPRATPPLRVADLPSACAAVLTSP
ncbi:penicillin-insensitive murein endopeptidase [Rubricella aquisinus]|uniref:Penicillin-insensitive murein endopeptidase n=1 Tax=Rubricella aquisinus TaxID=2028108 RepID=A0A840X0M1_9RHOB|nr:penicillin-insensitive murein endopeptidase [Rubricella aquisinus]